MDCVNAFSSVSLLYFLWKFFFVILTSSGGGCWCFIFTFVFIFLWLPFKSNNHFSSLVIIISFMIWKYFVFLHCNPGWLYNIFIVAQCVRLEVSAAVSKPWWAAGMATDGSSSFRLVFGTTVFTAFSVMLLDSCSSRWCDGGCTSESLPWNAKDFFSSHSLKRKKERKHKMNELKSLHGRYLYVSISHHHPLPFLTKIVCNWMPTHI